MGSQTIGGCMSEALKSFLQAYLSWVEQDAPVENVWGFYRGYAMCNNIGRMLYIGHHMGEYAKLDCPIFARMVEVVYELKANLIMDGLNDKYPFGGSDIFINERLNFTHHLNTERLAWVRKQLEIV